jgi:hypothetical protein
MTRGAPISDTTPEALAVHATLLADRSPLQRAERVRDLTATASILALAGLRERHPRATEQELLLRLAVLRLGAEVVARVYDWRAGSDGT